MKFGVNKMGCNSRTANLSTEFVTKLVLSTRLIFFFLQYGGEEHLNAPPKELLLAQTVSF